MKVYELAKMLITKFDPYMEVVTDGYESGFSDIANVEIVYLIRNKNGQKDGIYGKHGCDLHHNANDPNAKHDMEAIFIGEGRNIKRG